MLTQMRAISQNWIGRAILGAVLVITIVGFVFWGTNSKMGGSVSGTDLARVGDIRVSADEYRDAYQRQLGQIMERQKRQISSDEANRLGLNVNVFGTLLSRAALSAEGAKLGLSVSNEEIAGAIAADDRFKDRFGQFDKSLFFQFLANAGLNEAAYAREWRRIMIQQEVSDAVTTGLDTPKAMTAAFARYLDEVRDLHFFVLPASAAGTIPAPTDAQLKTYYDERANLFTAPEYRKLTVVSVVPADLVKPDSISDEDARKRYDAMKSTLYSVPEKRALEALNFPDAKAAAAAKAKIDAGTSFEALAAEEKKTPQEISLGTVAKAEINSPAIADAAFALPQGGTSAPLVGPQGPVIVHVSKIVAGHEQPLMEVQAGIKDQLAIIAASAEAAKIRDKIEDARQAGKSLAQAAQAAGIKPRTIDAIDAEGRDKAHRPVENLVDGPALLKAAFATDVGADTEAIPTPNKGYVWFDVQGIEQAHQLPLAEVKAKVAADWTADETGRRLAAEGDKLVKDLDSGKSVIDVAKAHGNLQVLDARNVGRLGSPQIPGAVASAFFGIPVGKAGSAAAGSDVAQKAGRFIFRIDAARVPKQRPDNEQFTKLMEKVREGYEENILAAFVTHVEQDVGLTFNQEAVKQAVFASDAGS